MVNKIEWESKTVEIDKLIPAEYNPRKISEESKKQLAKSLEKFEVADPIIINKDNKIIGGHQRYFLLKEQGIKEVPVRQPHRQLSEKEEKELNLRLNRNNGEWDYELLSNFDEQLLVDVGFDEKELDNIFSAFEPSEKDDKVPETRETDIKPGDLFVIGDHLLLCGDALNPDHINMLIGKNNVNMVFTDPPYGMDAVKNSGVLKDRYRDVLNDGSNDTAIDSLDGAVNTKQSADN